MKRKILLVFAFAAAFLAGFALKTILIRDANKAETLGLKI